MSTRFQVEHCQTDRMKPLAIWDVKDGLPGSGARLLARFDQTVATPEEACIMANALNAAAEAIKAPQSS